MPCLPPSKIPKRALTLTPEEFFYDGFNPTSWWEPWEYRHLLKKPRRKRPRNPPTLVSVAKQASKAGIEAARFEVKPDGTVAVVTGTPDPSTASNPWLADLVARQ